MISIIICSVNSKLLSNITKNIGETIGVEYELIVQNNYLNKSISQVYNDGINSATFDVIVLVHEDVIFHTSLWGHIILNVLSNKEIGLMGISGSVYKSLFPAPWTACDKISYRNSTIQHFNSNTDNFTKANLTNTSGNYEVAVLDGVFLGGRKEVLMKHKFDEKNLKGFHAYDIDISFSIGSYYKLVVTNDLIIEHLSQGKFNREWIVNSLIVHKKWSKYLPRKTPDCTDNNSYSDYLACSCFLNILIQNSYKKKLQILYYLILITRYFNYNKFKYLRVLSKNMFLICLLIIK